ncbi:MAG: stage III sporulation protein AE [Intestinimonas sp.]|jgi:stage III sporulation protein AE|nr:stage III sporulation protein AE [Intestinimonas sp.]
MTRRRRGRFLLAGLLLFALLMGTAAASGSEALDQQDKALGIDKLEKAGSQTEVTMGEGLNEGLQNILDACGDTVGGVARKAVRSGVLLLVIVLLCGLAETTRACGSEPGGSLDAVTIAGALAITAVAVGDAHSLIGFGRGAIDNMENFSKVLLPTMASVTAAGGAPTGAVARQMATLLFSDILMTLINRLLLPLVYTYLAACVAYAAVGNGGLRQIAGFLKWTIATILTAVMVIFVGYLTISGVIAGSADAAAVKAAKFTVSSMVPVVGSVLSDAAETVLAGAGILKNTVGVFGMLVVLSLCVIPFLQLGIHYLAYKLTAALSATVAEGRISSLISDIGGAFGLVLGMMGACALLLLVSLVSAVSMVMP